MNAPNKIDWDRRRIALRSNPHMDAARAWFVQNGDPAHEPLHKDMRSCGYCGACFACALHEVSFIPRADLKQKRTDCVRVQRNERIHAWMKDHSGWTVAGILAGSTSVGLLSTWAWYAHPLATGIVAGLALGQLRLKFHAPNDILRARPLLAGLIGLGLLVGCLEAQDRYDRELYRCRGDDACRTLTEAEAGRQLWGSRFWFTMDGSSGD